MITFGLLLSSSVAMAQHLGSKDQDGLTDNTGIYQYTAKNHKTGFFEELKEYFHDMAFKQDLAKTFNTFYFPALGFLVAFYVVTCIVVHSLYAEKCTQCTNCDKCKNWSFHCCCQAGAGKCSDCSSCTSCKDCKGCKAALYAAYGLMASLAIMVLVSIMGAVTMEL